MPRPPRFPSAVLLVLAACAPPRDRPEPPVAATGGPGASRPMQAPPAASAAFAAPLPDAEVERLLREHRVLPYAVYLGAAGVSTVHDVPRDSASPALVTAARARLLSGIPEGFCVRRSRHLAASGERGGRGYAPDFRDRVNRMALSDFERARRAEELLRSGAPVVYGLKVTGRPDDVLRLGRDPRVRRFHPAVSDGQGGMEVFGPEPPPEVQERGVSPEVERLSADEVAARLGRVLAEGEGRCRAWEWNAGMGGPATRVAPGDTAQGLRFHAAARVVPSGAGLPEGGRGDVQAPVAIRALLTVSNAGGRPLETGIRGCTTLLRVYRDAARTRPVWSEGSGRGSACMQAPRRLSLAPGESRDFEAGADAWHVLGDSLPPGTYHLSVLFRLADRTLEVPAGEAELSPRLEGLAFRAETRVEGVAPREMWTTATATNTTRRPIYLEYGACSLELRAFRTPERTGRPVWRSELRAPPGSDAGYGCPDYLATGTVAPGESFSPPEFQLRVPVHEVLGDSLPDGRYWLTATLTINFRRGEPFEAGYADLSSRRDPLPAERTAGGVRYRMEAARVRGTDSLRLSLTVTNPGDRPREAGGSRSVECPVSLLAYRSAAERDAWYLERRPAWSPAGCPLRVPRFTLAPGESRTVRGALRAAGLPAPAHLAAILWTEGERHPERVVLSAGEIR